LSMFSSATQKMYARTIDTIIDYTMNPTKENRMKMFWQLFSTVITTSFLLATIDAIWYGIGHGWDDDDWETLPARYAWQALRQGTGVPIVGQTVGALISNVDSQPWRTSIQDPAAQIMQHAAAGGANLLKGNFYKATKDLTSVLFDSKGLPMVPVHKAITWTEMAVKK